MNRISAWLLRVPERDSPLFRLGFAGMFVSASPFYIAAGLDIASGLGKLADVVLFYTGMILAIFIGHHLIGILLLLMRVKLPRLFLGGALSVFTTLFIIFYVSKINAIGASVVALFIMLTGFLLGSACYALFMAGRRTWLGILYGLLAIALFGGFHSWLFVETPRYAWTDSQRETVRRSAPIALDAPDPAQFGEYAYRTFTYGSGQDRLRTRFAEDAEVITSTVDGSSIIKEWDWSREWLWGFGADESPLNGSVWMPEGRGPFPLVLIVHGNHSMADYSDTGYDYLGQLLASRGFIAISVDENFINHSTWEGGLDTLSEDMTIRAWLLLQHLIEIEKLSSQIGNPFSGQVDFERIALIGHSRGGQAAVLAAQFDGFFAEDKYAPYRVNRDFGIDAVIAIAPTDILVYERRIRVNDINYLLLQGSNDADVNTFAGDRQYKRIGYSGNADRFKTSLYIRGANHGQFNTEWGRADVTHPVQLFLNDAELLGGEEQRTVAKVYVASFLETLFHDDDRYKPIFKDYRFALSWLPKTEYVSRYMASAFRLITDAEEDNDKTAGRLGTVLSTVGMETWAEEDLKNRRDESQLNRVIRLNPERAGASYILTFEDGELAPGPSPISALSFSLGVLSGDRSKVRMVTIELTDAHGTVARATLNNHVPVPGPITTRFLKIPFLQHTIRSGGLSTSSEPVLQTYWMPVSEWTTSEPAFDPALIRKMVIRFALPGRGDIILDEIGYYLS